MNQMMFTIYQRGVGRLLSLEADDSDDGYDEAIEAIGLHGLFGELTYVRFASEWERTDMGFQIVYQLGQRMWPDGTPKPHGRRNGQPDSAGGYALKHQWL